MRAYQAYKKQQIYQQRNLHLSDAMQRPMQDTDFLKTEFGKPYLAQTAALAFNHSDSQQHYALAISSHNHDIGVDVEDLARKVCFEA
ncbi:hypothetical protein [Acinetobacter sp. YH01020]|uniref:hypothetical protein n=2 Tax=Acinetobacter TaxID=469 RepID=UPI00211E93E3|nr:hypothetical protein [Acinetobacter sp. YH01020]